MIPDEVDIEHLKKGSPNAAAASTKRIMISSTASVCPKLASTWGNLKKFILLSSTSARCMSCIKQHGTMTHPQPSPWLAQSCRREGSETRWVWVISRQHAAQNMSFSLQMASWSGMGRGQVQVQLCTGSLLFCVPYKGKCCTEQLL